MEIRYAIVFRVEGMNLEEVLKDLSKYGRVTEVEDNILDDEPIKIIFITCSLGKSVRLKLDYNCVSSIENKYVLFPMENYEEKQKVIKSGIAR